MGLRHSVESARRSEATLKNRITQLIYAVACIVSAFSMHPVLAQEIVTYRGMCDASAAVALGQTHFMCRRR